MAEFERSAGILLHPTSLPGRYGIGDFGKEAYQFIDFLKKTGAGLWQIFPLGPTGYGDSPYQCLSAFAGNPLLISPDLLIEDGLFSREGINDLSELNPVKISFDKVIALKERLLRQAWEAFNKTIKSKKFTEEYELFYLENKDWLQDYADFMALKNFHRGISWNNWEPQYKNYKRFQEKEKPESLKIEADYFKFCQFLFFRQWKKLKNYVMERKIKIIGDIPIFISYDSADVWANQELFSLKENGELLYKAGVPPDYFSKTGQLWGNPHYRWDLMKKDDYLWWRKRFKVLFSQVDIVRLDHFRGFEAYWEIPGNAENAVKGKWQKGPGAHFFKILEKHLGTLPIIAEDLGVITEEVEKLRKSFNFPGMKILQFAFDSDMKNSFLPHNFEKNFVVYTGSHDNDTTIGWYKQFLKDSPLQAELVKKYTNTDGWEINWIFIRMALSSVCLFAIVPMQDILSLDTETRMNFPGKPEGNWQWRYRAAQLRPEITERFREIVYLYGRENMIIEEEKAKKSEEKSHEEGKC